MKLKPGSKFTLKPHNLRYFDGIWLNWLFHIGTYLTLYYTLKHIFIYKSDYNITHRNWFFDMAIPLLGVLNFFLFGFYFVLYYYKIPYFENMKINKLPWPWEENPVKFRRMLPGAIIRLVMNQFIIVPVLVYGIVDSFGMRLDIESIPPIHNFWLGIIGCISVEDFFFYWIHRALHHPLLYQKIHKIHHKFYNVINISFAYSHPLEYIGTMMAIFASIYIFGSSMHLLTFVGFTFIRTIETNETHSGYEFTFSIFRVIPWATDSTYHNYHHLKNVGNYSSFFRIWDKLFGTNHQYNIEVK